MPISSSELSRMIFDALSDGYDDEENREETETALYNELSQLPGNSNIRITLQRLCERVEELEEDTEKCMYTPKVDTEIFTYSHVNNYTCFAEVLKDVNSYIAEKGISKDDIIEYRTDNTYNERTNLYTLTVIFSWCGIR